MNVTHRTIFTVALCVLPCFVKLNAALQFPLNRQSLKRARLPFVRRKYSFPDQDEEEARRIIGRPVAMSTFMTKQFLIVKRKRRIKERKLERKKLNVKRQVPVPNFRSQSSYSYISNVHELRNAVLDNGQDLEELENISQEEQISPKELLNHQVLELIANRFHSGSTPSHRHEDDTYKLALSMEGGGMRGAVTAGMAAAIGSLGLCDTFDSIYGSSAGSIVGSYMVSRQMCVDVYTSVLTAAQGTFVCKKRLIGGIALSAMDLLVAKQKAVQANPGFFREKVSPAMNISFVLDGILDEQHGLRPLDIDTFRTNDIAQPLRVASSTVQNGKLRTMCFGTTDFFNYTDANGKTVASAACSEDGSRQGLFACLEPSMMVPGAAGPPINLFLQGNKETSSTCFDAFCFEPIPYRSAVEEGATHVLALRSRPEGFQAVTKPGVYEKTVTPLYFNTHGQPEVAKFFKKGGQQYLYMEDLLTLEEGKNAGVTNDNKHGISVPPATVLYGVEEDEEIKAGKNRENWKKAHLLPISVPKGTKELPVLEQGKDEVMAAVRGGYAAAFDILAPAIGLDIDPELTGDRVAELMFPNVTETIQTIMETQLSVKGVMIEESKDKFNILAPAIGWDINADPTGDRMAEFMFPDNIEKTKASIETQLAVEGFRADPSTRKRRRKRKILRKLFRQSVKPTRTEASENNVPIMDMPPSQIEPKERCRKADATALLSALPGIEKIPNLAEGLILSREQAAFE